jgi:hypothetical protein
VTTTFNTEMNKQIRELTADEMEAVTRSTTLCGGSAQRPSLTPRTTSREATAMSNA